MDDVLLVCFREEVFGDGGDPVDLDLIFGRERRYHPPTYVNAISWYSNAASSLDTCTQPTTQRSSSGSSSPDERADRDMCADCVGILYCA